PRADDLLAQVACAPPGGAVRQSRASLRLDLRGPRRGSAGGLAHPSRRERPAGCGRCGTGRLRRKPLGSLLGGADGHHLLGGDGDPRRRGSREDSATHPPTPPVEGPRPAPAAASCPECAAKPQRGVQSTLERNERVRSWDGLLKIWSGGPSSRTCPPSNIITRWETSRANCISWVTSSIVMSVVSAMSRS